MQQWDKYGRILAYVYLQDGTFVNAWPVEHGYAQVMTVQPNVKYQDLLLKLQREAREAGRGLWGEVGHSMNVANGKTAGRAVTSGKLRQPAA